MLVESEPLGRRDDLEEEEPPPGFLRPREVGSSVEDDLDFDLDLPNLNFFMMLLLLL